MGKGKGSEEEQGAWKTVSDPKPVRRASPVRSGLIRLARRTGWSILVIAFLLFAPWMRFDTGCWGDRGMRTYYGNTTREFSRALIDYLRRDDEPLLDTLLNSFRYDGKPGDDGFFWRNPLDGQVYTTLWRTVFDFNDQSLNATSKAIRAVVQKQNGGDVDGNVVVMAIHGGLTRSEKCELTEGIAYRGFVLELPRRGDRPAGVDGPKR